MKFTEKFDTVITGLISGILLPLLVGLVIYFFTAKGISIPVYLQKIYASNIVTHAITLCVFPNVLIFLVFNRYDMLRGAKGVLAMTLIWAIIVFGVKFFG